jgi:uncharacterized protein YjbI with pentapeptide repeats
MRSRTSSALIAVGSLGALLVAAAVIYGYTTRPGWVGVANKTLWDWLELFIVPIVIAAAGFLLSTAAERERELQQRERELSQARGQRERELELEDQRGQADALQSYIDTMSQLVTEKYLRRRTHWLDEALVTARAQSLTVLSRLDGERKRILLQFLHQAQLINRDERMLTEEEREALGPDSPTEFGARIVGLSGADLRNANLRYLRLEGAALNGTILENADLRDAWLGNSDFGGAYLSGADLSKATLRGASLVNAQLQRKDEGNLGGARLRGADLRDADLRGADLRGASLVNADLREADFGVYQAFGVYGETEKAADLTGADLSNANLTRAKITKEQLGSCRSLGGATMPNGQKYQDWLKDKKAHEENE